MTLVLLQVPITDGDDLTALGKDERIDEEPFESRPFDGEAVWQLVVGGSTVSIPVLRAWIRARAESRKEYRVVIDGVEMTGYSATEVERILGKLDEIGPPSNPSDA